MSDCSVKNGVSTGPVWIIALLMAPSGAMSNGCIVISSPWAQMNGCFRAGRAPSYAGLSTNPSLFHCWMHCHPGLQQRHTLHFQGSNRHGHTQAYTHTHTHTHTRMHAYTTLSFAPTLTDGKICVGDRAYPILPEPQLKNNTLGMLMNFYFTLH